MKSPKSQIKPQRTLDIKQSNLKSLQTLRAIAAISVVYYHIGAVPAFGSFGVDIFFVISGFVMAMVVASGQSAKMFAVGRLSRIIPLYWILTTCVLLLAIVKPELLNSTTANLSNYLKSILFIPYFKENGALHPMLAVGWTLNYEMFFYFCIWFAIVATRRFYVPLTLLLLTAAFIGLGKSSGNPVLASFFGNNLIFEFVFGIFTFEIYKKNLVQKVNKHFLVFIAVISYCLMAVAETSHFEIQRLYIYGIPSISLVLALSSIENTIFNSDSSYVTSLTAIGDGSYATYLSHYYVVEGIRKIAFQKLNLVNPYAPIGVLVIVTSSLMVGHVIFTLLDRPLHKYFKTLLSIR